MNQDKLANKAGSLFLDGFHCSQAVFYAGMKILGKSPKDMEEVLATLSPFGGGLGSTGNVCGCLPGALAVLGVSMGKKCPEEKDHKDMWRLSYKMVKTFEEITARYEGMNCRDIARVDWKSREEVKEFRVDLNSRRRECVYVIGETVKALERLLKATSA